MQSNDTETELSELDPKWGELSAWHDPRTLANFRARPTDILITTAAKAGTTWMQQILHQLRTGGDDRFRYIDDVVPWLEIPHLGKSWQAQLAEFEALENPRIFKTHCTYPQTPGIGTARYILTSRDPRDCCVSFYHHLMDMTDEAREQFDLKAPDSFDSFFEEWLAFAGWYRNVESWWPHYRDEDVLWLRFEDLKRDLKGSIGQILDFLGWSITNDQLNRVLELCSFKWMKENAQRFMHHSEHGVPHFKADGFIRRGQTGDGKALLTAEQEKRVLDLARDRLEPDCLEFLGINR